MRRSSQLEDVHCVGSGGHAQEGRSSIERHAINTRGHGAAAELVELARGRNGKDSDDGSFVGGCCEKVAGVIHSDA